MPPLGKKSTRPRNSPRSPLGDEIFRLRSSRGLSQQDVAEGVGVSGAFIGGLETGAKSTFSIDVLWGISDALGVSPIHWRPLLDKTLQATQPEQTDGPADQWAVDALTALTRDLAGGRHSREAVAAELRKLADELTRPDARPVAATEPAVEARPRLKQGRGGRRKAEPAAA